MWIENYLGFPTGITGADLMDRAVLQAQKFGAELSTPSPVLALELGGPRPAVRIEGGERVEARCILIATGADYRKGICGRRRPARSSVWPRLRGEGAMAVKYIHDYLAEQES